MQVEEIVNAYKANEVSADASLRGPMMIVDEVGRVGKDGKGAFIELRRDNPDERVKHEVNDLVLQAHVEMSDPRTADWVALARPGDFAQLACSEFLGKTNGLSENHYGARGCILLENPVKTRQSDLLK